MTSNSVKYVGVNDKEIDLFECQYSVPNGMTYNSYIITDERIAVTDSVDAHFGGEWLRNIENVLRGKKPDYLIVQHMEPDHSASILRFMQAYPDSRLIASERAFPMMKNYFGEDLKRMGIPVSDGDVLPLGSHELRFISAPMVHWPEVILTYEAQSKILFSADAFGKFGALDACNGLEAWKDEARRYYFGIVGKYGAQVQTLLKKLDSLDIRSIYPLHGPALTESIEHYIGLYDIWSSYLPEDEGIVIAYTSVYGNTKSAVLFLSEILKALGRTNVVLYDLARCDMSKAVSDAFRYSKLVLASTTYNGGVFPFMRTFIEHLTERNYKSRTVALIENGSWAPAAAKTMREMLSGSKDIKFCETSVRILSALSEKSRSELEGLAKELI